MLRSLFHTVLARRRRLAVALVAVLAVGYGLATGAIPGVSATFSAETENSSSSFAGGWIPAPTGLSDAVAGSANDQRSLSWTSGASAASPSPNPVTGQTILAADGGSGDSASCGAYSTLTTLSATATSYSDSAGTAADWWCYQVVSTSATTWTTAATFTPVRLFVPISVVLGNGGGTLGTSEAGDTITITYNQDVKVKNPQTVAVHVCKNQGLITIGAGCTGTPSIGEVTGVTVSANNNYAGSTIAVSGPTITITLVSSGTATVSGNGPFIASGTKVVALSDGTNVCGGSACQPTSSGSF